MRCFLSYRRSDSESLAKDLFLHFAGRFGRGAVFWDHESIPADHDWEKVIRRDLEASDVVLALVGPAWASTLRERMARSEVDYVRFELEHARRCGRPVVVLPFDGASIPAADQLPPGLAYLARQQSPPFDLSYDRPAQLEALERRLVALAPSDAPVLAHRIVQGGRWPWNSSGGARLEDEPAWWREWNFHDPELLTPLTAAVMRADDSPNVLVVHGLFASGRRYVVRAAARAARDRGVPVLSLPLSLEGYETTDRDVLRRYLKFQGDCHGLRQPGEFEELISWAETHWRSASASVDFCAACGVLLELTKSFRQVGRFLADSAPGSQRLGGGNLLGHLLRELCGRQRVLLHTVDPASLACTLHDDLLSTAARTPNLVVALSAFEGQSADDLAGGHDHAQWTVWALRRDRFNTLLDERCRGNGVPDWLRDWLWSASRGNRGRLAVLVRSLFQDDVFEFAEDGRWRFRETDETREILQRSFADVVLRPVERLYRDVPQLQRVLQTAAVCGEFVPIDVVCGSLDLKDDARSVILDAVDDHLADSEESPLLRDHQFQHPGFSGTPVYQFLNPLVPEMLLASLTPDARATLALRLLEFLEKHLPAGSRSVALLYLHLLRQLPARAAARAAWEQRLGWWLGLEECERLRTRLTQSLAERRISAESIWAVVEATKQTWPPLRRLALVEAYESQADGVPFDQMPWLCREKGILLNELARYAESEPLLRRALAIDERVHGADHASVGTDLYHLAYLLRATNRLTEAEPLMRRALAIDERCYGADHPRVARHLANLASLLQATNRLADAEPLMRRALTIDERSCGPDHPNVAASLNSLALLLKETNHQAEAEPLVRRALAIDERSHGPVHPRVARDLNNLALLLQDMYRLAEAELLMRRALAIDEQSLGPDHPSVACDLHNLSLLLEETNRLAEAEPLMRRHVAIYQQFRRATGHIHPHWNAARAHYRGLLVEMGLGDAEIADRLRPFLDG